MNENNLLTLAKIADTEVRISEIGNDVVAIKLRRVVSLARNEVAPYLDLLNAIKNRRGAGQSSSTLT